MSQLRQHVISFKNAFAGLWYSFSTQPNFQVHIAIALLILFSGLYFKLTQLEWIIISFTVFLVLLAEMINTSIESVVDLLTDKYHLQAKIAKDVSAGMVLLATIASVIIGLLIFLPHLFPSLLKVN